MDRVLVVIRIEAPSAEVKLLSPPDASAPSACWMQKLVKLLKPIASEPSALQCCILGSLAEVSSHLWQHQTLWLQLKTANCVDSDHELKEEDRGRNVEVPFSELIDAAADLSGTRYARTVTLEEETLDGSGTVNVSLHLEVVQDFAGVAAAPIEPSIPDAFVLDLHLSKGGSALVTKAFRMLQGASRGLYLRCSGVEQPLQDRMQHVLVLVESWAEVSQALTELDAHIQVPLESSRDFMELPLDLSQLIAAATARGGTDMVSAVAKSLEFPSLGEGLTFTASVRSYRWTMKGKLEPGCSKDAEIVVDGVCSDPRRWRISVEVKSLRLTNRTANAFIAYLYGPLQQPRPFRTSPPTLARKNSLVYLPHGFSAYTMISATQELQSQLEESLHIEVWHRDMYKKDGIIGMAEANIGGVFDCPVQHSSSMPSMVRGFRVLDQVCPIVGSAEPSPEKVGALRLLFFLEDLGPAETLASSKLNAATESGRVTASKVPVANCRTEDLETPQQGNTMSSVDTLKAIRGSPAYATAYELELWKRAEEEKFRTHLADLEASMRDKLEEEYRQKELKRAKEFRLRQNELRDIEGKAMQKLQELQDRDAAVTAEERRVKILQEDSKRRSELAIKECEDASRLRVAEADQALHLERSRSRYLEQRVAELESELAGVRQQLKEAEADFYERRRHLDETPAAQLQQEIQALQLQLKESDMKAKTLAGSRDHFRAKVEELCKRLLHNEKYAYQRDSINHALAGSSLPHPEENSCDALAPGVQNMSGVAQALHKIQDDLAQLAHNWGGETHGNSGTNAGSQSELQRTSRTTSVGSRVQETSGNPNTVAATTTDGAAQHTRHLQWLHAQRDELLQSGLYSESDPVLRAIDAKIAEASGL